MDAVLLLADVARVADGKLDLLGAGWTIIGPDPMATAIGILVTVPWAEMDVEHASELVLLTGEGEVVTDAEGHPVARVQAKLAAQRQPGVLLGSPATIPLAISIPPLPLEPGRQYRWRLTIDGNQNVAWEAPFHVRPRPGPGRMAS